MKNIVYLFLFVFPFSLIGQDIKQAESLTAQATQAADAGKLDQAIQLSTQAAAIYEGKSNWEGYLNCGVSIGNYLIQGEQYDKAIENTQRFIDKAKKNNQTNLALSLLYKNLGRVYYAQHDEKSALPNLEQALKIREQINHQDPELARDYGNVGIVSRLSGRYGKAIEYLNKATKLQKDKNVLARLYNELGVNYKLLGDFRKSLDNQNQAIQLLEGGEDKRSLASALQEKGTTLTELKQEGEDIPYLQQALKLFQSPEAFDYINQMLCYKQMAYSYLRFSQTSTTVKNGLDSAMLYNQKALDIATKHIPVGNSYTYQILLDMSSALSKKGSFDQAQEYITKSDQLTVELLQTKSIEAANILNTKAITNRLQGDFVGSLKNYQLEINSLLLEYDDNDFNSLPTKEQLIEEVSLNNLQNAVAGKARCWYQYYKHGGKDKKNLEAALKTIELFDEIINKIRAEFAGSGSNVAWSDLTLDAYENAIEICLAMAQETGDVKYKKQALFYSEKSKGLTLLESFQNTKAIQVAGLSEEELIKEREMKLDINDLEQKVFHLTQQRKPELIEEIKAVQKQIFLKKQNYQDFLKKLEAEHPKYYSTKYNINILNVEEIRAMLKDEQGLIEYFVGDSSVFAFKITKTDFDAYTLDGHESMTARVNDFRNSIYGYFLSSKDKSEQMQSKFAKQYAERAYKMYQVLVEPLGKLPKRLIIVPAGPMCDMPFESLLTQKVSDPAKYKSHPYFIREHVISYTYSATLLKEMSEQEHAPVTNTYLGFAPSFGESAASVIRGKRYALSPLAHNKTEVENISTLLGGKMYHGKDAIEHNFKSVASDYQIIHFATHGMANSNDPDYSLLAFTEIADGQENEFLYVSDLYNMELNADMVILSACETALGKNFRGEGIMSMARGFSYAGAKSIFTTLWCVNDHSTCNITQGYFKYLQEGKDKDEALQLAKLDYLDAANDLMAHPFLWSPYILVGDTNDVPSITNGMPWTYIGGGALVLVLLGFVGMRMRGGKKVV